MSGDRISTIYTVKVTVALNDGEAPDIVKKRGRVVFAPTHLAIQWHSKNGETWRLDTIAASGPQRFSSGETSKKYNSSICWQKVDYAPSWVQPYVTANAPGVPA